MDKLFSVAISPITMLWDLAERHIWLSIALMTAIAAIAWPLRYGAVTVCALFVLSVLLMRVDPITEAKAAVPAESAEP